MRSSYLSLLLILALAGDYVDSLQSTAFGRAPATAARLSRVINPDWTFQYFPQNREDAAPADPAFDDAAWPAVALPHTWSTYETTHELHPFIRNVSEKDDPYWWHGWGWYRKRLVLDSRLAGRKLFLEFDGVQKYARIYMNGIFVGEHKGGFTSFSIDVTDEVRLGGENLLAVCVSNRLDDDFGHIPPMTAGNWAQYGGIYRDVHLAVKDPIHFPFQGAWDHEGGTFVTTPRVSALSGLVRVRAFVKNEETPTAPCTVTNTLVDPEGQEICSFKQTATVAPGEIHMFDQTSPEIPCPKLWSPEKPQLYRILTRVHSGGRLRDECESPLGFRWFHWDQQENVLVLNGRKTHMHGANRHQEYPWLGDAIPKWMHEMDLRDMRLNLRHNFMRTCHYPQDPLVYDLADQLGILICEEVPNIKNIDFGEEIQERNVREMIRRDRNHPSIIIWSMGNETNDAADSAWAWAEDDTRILHARHVVNDSAGKFVTHTHKQYEMENLLQCTVRGWYGRDDRDLTPENCQHTGNETWQHDRALRKVGYNQKGEIRINGAIWIYADHGADREYKNAPLKHLNPKGWVDPYRIPKYMYYLYQANWSARPMVFIHPHYWRKAYVGGQREIVVDSNCDSVELRVNGRAIGMAKPSLDNLYCVRFKNVPIEPGELTAVGVKNGNTVTATVRMAGTPARIVLSTLQPTIVADLAGIAVVRADIVDAAGVPVLGANDTLHWRIEGPGRLVGPECYQSNRDDREAMDGVWYIDAPICNVVRSTTQPGKIVVTVSAEGLQPGCLAIESLPAPLEDDQGIGQPRLTDRGRHPVIRIAPATDAAEIPAGGILPVREDLTLTGDSQDDYAIRIDALLRRRQEGLRIEKPAWDLLIGSFARLLVVNEGLLVADDFNFLAGNYNEYLKLSALVDTSPASVAVREALKAEYADSIITRGLKPDLAEVKRRLEKLAAGEKYPMKRE